MYLTLNKRTSIEKLFNLISALFHLEKICTILSFQTSYQETNGKSFQNYLYHQYKKPLLEFKISQIFQLIQENSKPTLHRPQYGCSVQVHVEVPKSFSSLKISSCRPIPKCQTFTLAKFHMQIPLDQPKALTQHQKSILLQYFILMEVMMNRFIHLFTQEIFSFNSILECEI